MGPMEIAQLVFKAVCGCEAKCGEGQVGGPLYYGMGRGRVDLLGLWEVGKLLAEDLSACSRRWC